MNYKGNAFSAGAGRISDAVSMDGKIHFLQQKGSAYDHRVFDPDKKSFAQAEKAISYADCCWFFDGELLQLFGQKLSLGQS